MRNILFTLLLAIFARPLLAQGAPPQVAPDQPYTVEYYYKVQWGHQQEFLQLFLKNHYPLLQKIVESGRMISVKIEQPANHMTEDARWDYRVTIRFKNSTMATTANPDEERVVIILTPALRAKILAATRRKPKDGSTHWSCRKLAAAINVSKDMVHRVWQEAGLKPHRLERYLASDDPDFETKAADVIGLYLNPPQHAAVFCVDEKTAIQALDRLDPVLPLSPGRAERHGFEYYRHGTLSLYAALDTKTGRVHGKTAAHHTSTDFVDFLGEVVSQCRPRQEIHIILDNLSAHKTQAVRDFLDTHPKVRLHFTPTYSSWLNQVELWFAKIERDVIARGVFTSVPDLARKLRRYMNAYSANAQPIRWKYSDVTRRIRSNDLVATGHLV